MIQYTLKQKLPLLLSIFLFFSVGCASVRLITDYDDVTYTTINSIQEKITTFFVDLDQDLGTSKAKYADHKDFYRDLKVKIGTLKLRANAMDKNQIVIQQIDLLEMNIKNLEALDKMGISTRDEIIPLKNAFDSTLTAMIKLQLALKRGKSN